jgi:hypothetical protein
VAFTLDRILSIGCYREHAFKFGITSIPSVCWTAFPDYKYLDLMVLIYTSENSDDTARFETQCIAERTIGAIIVYRIALLGARMPTAASPLIFFILFLVSAINLNVAVFSVGLKGFPLNVSEAL